MCIWTSFFQYLYKTRQTDGYEIPNGTLRFDPISPHDVPFYFIVSQHAIMYLANHTGYVQKLYTHFGVYAKIQNLVRIWCARRTKTCICNEEKMLQEGRKGVELCIDDNTNPTFMAFIEWLSKRQTLGTANRRCFPLQICTR